MYAYGIALLLLFFFIQVFGTSPKIEGFQEQSKVVIALLCVCPTERVIEFAKNYATTHQTKLDGSR